MLEGGEDLSLAAEPGERQFRIDVALHDLDRDALLVLIVGAGRLVHRAHAAHADEAHDGVGAEPLADQRWR